jgi:hypothetical protein
MYGRRLNMCTSAGGVERVRPRADHADDLAAQRVERNLAGRMCPDARRQRAEHLGDLRAARSSVAVREHELARRLDTLRAVGLQVQAQQIALRLDLDETRAVANLRVRRLLEPGQVVGPREARNSVERVERRGPVQCLVPRAEAQRDVAAFRPRRHRLRCAQLAHACDRAPDAGLTGLGAIDHVDLADALALEGVRDRQAAMAGADDHDVVIRAGARAHPIGGFAPGPAQHAGRLFVELLARGRRGRCGWRTRRSGCRLREHGGCGQAAYCERCGAAEKTPAVDLVQGTVTFVGHIGRSSSLCALSQRTPARIYHTIRIASAPRRRG